MMREIRRRQLLAITAVSIAMILALLQFHIVLGQAPTATTGAATGVGETSATLNGTVNANGYSTTVYFEVGYDTYYEWIVPAVPSPVTGSTDTPVQAALSGLSAETTYHYRIVSVNPNGTTYGADMDFTTLDSTAVTMLNFHTRLGLISWLWPTAILLGLVICALLFGLQRYKRYNR